MFRRAVPGVDQGRTRPGARRGRSAAILGAASALAVAALTVGASGTALAQTRAHVCGTESSGYSWGQAGGNQVDATRFTKKPPGCLDFNLVYIVTDTGLNDDALGQYWTGSAWQNAMSGKHMVTDNTWQDVVLLTDVATGTLMKVTTSGGQDLITMDY
jgi:hypothetical protein